MDLPPLTKLFDLNHMNGEVYYRDVHNIDLKDEWTHSLYKVDHLPSKEE